MNFELFNQLYIEALEQSNLEYYIADRGWQEWMESYEDREIAEILSTIHSLANSSLAESRGCSRTEFARRFDIPIRTLEDWDSGKRSGSSYVKKLIDFALFVDR